MRLIVIAVLLRAGGGDLEAAGSMGVFGTKVSSKGVASRRAEWCSEI